MSLSKITNQEAVYEQPIPGSALRLDWRELSQTLVVLFKLRVVSLLLMAAVGGAFLATGGWPGSGELLLLLLTGGLAAAGSSALNQYIEKDVDRKMVRTRRRPLVTGAISRPGWVPYVATGMILGPSLAVAPWNPALAFFLLAGAFIYVVVYTLWLKPRTLLNIVIGGAAGSAAVLSGSAAVGNWADPGALLLALLVFLWTPTHFWSLALVYKDDYARSQTPMLPTRTTPGQAAFWIAFHTLGTAVIALALTLRPGMGWLYLVPVGLATLDLMLRNVRLLALPDRARAFSLFKASNLYLTIVILFACLDALM